MIGFSMKSTAPARIASTAVRRSPSPLSRIVGALTPRSRICRNSSIPLMPGQAHVGDEERDVGVLQAAEQIFPAVEGPDRRAERPEQLDERLTLALIPVHDAQRGVVVPMRCVE